MTGVELDAVVQQALDTARGLASVGVPLFVAERDPAGVGHNNTGFWLPSGWQQTVADPAVVDAWRVGMALCAVMGHGLDLLDVDPRNGGALSELNGSTPATYGVVLTPSDGLHSYIASLGVGSRDNIYPGIDVKGGAADGSSRGFAFLPPTVRVSKTTGEPAPYRWAQTPDLARLRTVLAGEVQDGSGTKLAARIRELKVDGGVRKLGGPDWYREFLANREPQSAPAAERAINTKLEEITSWTAQSGVGFRGVLLRAAMTLGGYVGGGYLDEGDAREKLIAATGTVWGAPDDNDLLWIEQGITDGQAQPFYVYTAADELASAQAAAGTGGTDGADGGEPPWTVYTTIGTNPFDPTGDGTDQGMAEAVAARLYPALRFGVDSGLWLVRGPQVWTEREDMSSWAISTVARLMPLGQTPVPKEVGERTEMHWQAVRRARFMESGGAGRIERKLRSIVRNVDHPAGIEVASLDADPEILWAGGQPYDLRACSEAPTLADIDPATPHLRTAQCAPAPVPTPHWDRFVAAVWPDPDLRTWALRVLSIALAGYPDAALPVLYGPERTGKTSLIQLVVEVLGSYAHAADPRLLAGADNAHASVVYVLKGRRLSFIDEGPRRGHLASERLKQLTGGGVLTGNAMRSNPITFAPTHTLVMTTNDEPPVTDPALRARMRIIPCEADQFAVRAARKAITPAVWRAEAPGVLARLMAECAAWLADPDSAAIAAAPTGVQGAVEEMASGQDPIREWIEMCTLPAEPGTSGRELYRRFRAWLELQPIYRKATAPTETMFGRTLTEAGYPVRPNQGPRYNQNFRPLTVMTGPGVPAPWEPGGSGAGMPPVPTSPGSPAGSPSVPGSPAGAPSGSDHPRSGPVFSSFTDSTEGTYRTNNNNNYIHTPKGVVPEKLQGNRSETLDDRGAPGENLVRPAPMPEPEPRDRESGTGLEGHETVTKAAKSDIPRELPTQTALDLGKHTPAPAQAESSRRVTNADVAARAYQGGPEKKITKAEARKQLQAEQREAAIAEAAGEVLALPAVVDRAQHVLPVTPEQAAAVVRSGLAQTGALTVDVETSGYPVGHQHYELRSVQLGGPVAAAVFHPVTHAGLIRELLAEATRLHAHSASADLVPLAHAGLIEAEAGWAKMHDTVIPAKLSDPQSTGSDPGLKQLSEAVLGVNAVAPFADAGRDALWKAARWQTGKQRFVNQLTTPLERNGWAQVPTGCTTMLRYAASDVLDTAALAQVLPAVPESILARERLAEAMTARVAHRGLRIDAARVRELVAEHTGLREAATARVRAFGPENPGSGLQVAQALKALGETLPVSEKGNESVAEHVLSVIKRSRPDTPAGQLATAVLDYRHSNTVLGLFLAPYTALCERADARMRPTVYTLGTDTGRMCLPREHSLVTMYGYVKANDVVPGLLTLDADGRWVRVTAVHRYADAPLQTLSNRGIELACTPEHCWVTTREHEAGYARKMGHPVPPRELRRLDDHPRLRVHLTAEVEPFDFGSRTIPAETDGQRFAALVGMLVTDGRCTEGGGPEIGMRAHVYQTEAKFYDEFRRVIPADAIMYDRVTTNGDGHHEIRIRSRWLRPRLKAVDLRVGAKLKESPDLYLWVARLPEDELRAFFAACWLADGSLARKGLSCGSENLRQVLALAAYRLGQVAYVSNEGMGGWSTKDRLALRFREPVITVRKSEHGVARGDVWCVTTETGTFTAVNPQGTVYLTGNSSVRPNIQQLPREGGVRSVVTADPGHVLISADFSGVELRGAAALSQDPTMMHMIAEEDAGRFDGFHWAVARQAFGPDATKSDRYVAKRGVFGKIYGGGVATLAKQVGVTEHEMGAIVASLDTLTPGLSQWSDQIRFAVRRGHTQFPSYSGRIIHFPAAYPHKSPNYAIQGSCRELLVDALVRWRDTRWGDCTLVPVHDELIVMVPEEDAEVATAELVRCMEGELYGVKIVAEPSAPSFAWQDSS